MGRTPSRSRKTRRVAAKKRIPSPANSQHLPDLIGQIERPNVRHFVPGSFRRTLPRQTRVSQEKHRSHKRTSTRSRLSLQLRLFGSPRVHALESELADKLFRDRRHLFQCRLGRELTAQERETLAARAREMGADRVGELVLKSSASELIAWLGTQ